MNAIRTFALSSLIILSLSATARGKESADTLSRELQEVVVTARQPATKLVGSTLVSTIAGSNLADLGNALDVLAQLPLIKVEDNTVSVIGKSEIEIFIDGRPMRDEFELQQLLSSNIKTVELQMAPGAAYESTTGAVLRITTKRNFAKGISLTDQFQVQRRRRWSVMDHLSIVYRFGNWELFANGTINHNNSLAKGETTNTLIYDEKPATIGATQHNAYPTTTGDFKTDGRRDEDVSRRHHLLTPDISLGYTFNFNSQLSLSYKMATVKPPYSQLTGSLNYVGVHEIEGGNPALRDEHMHDLQLLGTWRDFILQGNFIRSLDSYAFVKQLYPAPNLQLLMHPVNINVSAVSAYLLWSKPVGCWTPDVTVGVYRQWLTLDCTKHNKPLFSYYFDNTFVLPKGWMITANVSGRSEGDMHTNRFGATWFTMDASIGRTLLNKSLTIKLTATDIFNTANHDWTMSTLGIFVSKRQSYDRHGIAFNIIYHCQPRKSAYKGSPASESELRRL